MVALAKGTFTRRNCCPLATVLDFALNILYSFPGSVSYVFHGQRVNVVFFFSLLDSEDMFITCYIKKHNDRELFALHLSGRTPEELLPSFRSRLFYKELHNAVTDGLQAKLISEEGQKSFCFYFVVVLLLVICCVGFSLLRA